MKCPYCNGEVFPGQVVCDHCGRVIANAKPKKTKKEKENGK